MPFWNVHEGKKTELMSKRAKILLFEGELEEAKAFLSDARQPEVICGRSGTICPKTWTKPMLKNAKSPFPVDVRR